MTGSCGGDELLPPDAASLLARTLDEVAGALGILWAASRGIQSLIVALNVVYAVPAARPWWRRQIVAMVDRLAAGAPQLVLIPEHFDDLVPEPVLHGLADGLAH